MSNIAIFQETVTLINTNQRLNAATTEAIKNTVVYPENFSSKKRPNHKAHVRFEENLTLLAAERLAKSGKTAVLNFANPLEPGGGVLRGANAQEEYLCRASNLYPCLVSEQAKPYYNLHEEMYRQNACPYFLSSDSIVYSKGVTVIRKDVGFFANSNCKPTQEYTDDWYEIDVITCAAPLFFNRTTPISTVSLKEILKKRIRNIFESAIENNVQALVLGAFGCGAFRNPPTLVATSFSEVLLEKRYKRAFKDVVFAVKRTDFFCENIEAFEIAFSTFPPTGEYVISPERNKRRLFE